MWPLIATTVAAFAVAAWIGLSPGEQVPQPRPLPPTQVISETVAVKPIEKPKPVETKPQIPPKAEQTSEPPAQPKPHGDAIIEEDVRLAINVERQKAGLNPLEFNESLNGAAFEKANDEAIRQYFAHVDPDGNKVWPLIAQHGYTYKDAGENLAVDFVSLSAMTKAWMASPSHKKNILDPRFKDIGVGIVIGSFDGREDVTYVVTLFGNPK